MIPLAPALVALSIACLVALLKEKAQNLKVGCAYDEETKLGPVVHAKHKESVCNWIQKGIDEGQWEVSQPSEAMQAELQVIYKEIWEEYYDKYGAEIMDPILSGEYKTLSAGK